MKAHKSFLAQRGAGAKEIRLRDTMVDMILEGLGALVVALGMWLDRGRHMLFVPRKESEVRC